MPEQAVESAGGRAAPPGLSRSPLGPDAGDAAEHGQPAAFRRPAAGLPPADRALRPVLLSATPVPERIYADPASTTPLAPEVVEAMLPHLRARLRDPSNL